jgi:hypothetical protein
MDTRDVMAIVMVIVTAMIIGVVIKFKNRNQIISIIQFEI